MKLIEVFEVQKAIADIENQELDYESAYRIACMKAKLAPNAEFYSREEKKLVEDYGVRNEDGSLIIKGNQIQIPSEKIPEFSEKKNNLNNVEIDVGEKPLIKVSKVKPSTLESLIKVFTFPEV